MIIAFSLSLSLSFSSVGFLFSHHRLHLLQDKIFFQYMKHNENFTILNAVASNRACAIMYFPSNSFAHAQKWPCRYNGCDFSARPLFSLLFLLLLLLLTFVRFVLWYNIGRVFFGGVFFLFFLSFFLLFYIYIYFFFFFARCHRLSAHALSQMPQKEKKKTTIKKQKKKQWNIIIFLNERKKKEKINTNK